jgi:hypothetical protein
LNLAITAFLQTQLFGFDGRGVGPVNDHRKL